MSRCLSCNRVLSSRESTRKYRNYELIPNPEDRYIGLCSTCCRDIDLDYVENTSLPDDDADNGMDYTSIEEIDSDVDIMSITDDDRL